MNWLDEIESEMNRGREAERIGNQGKARTAARRAVGIAITQFQNQRAPKQYGDDVMKQLRGIAGDLALPENIREAAMRLQMRVSQEFTSPSQQPLEDARLIIEFVRQALTL